MFSLSLKQFHCVLAGETDLGRNIKNFVVMPISFQLLKLKSKFSRIDFLILALLYPLTIIPSVYLMSQHWIPENPKVPSEGTFAFIIDHLDVPKLEEYTLIVLAPFIVATIHVLVFLISTWSINFKRWLCYSNATEEDATHALFIPKPHRGSAEIVEIIRGDQVYAVYQQKKRLLINGKFESLTYPTNLTVGEYLNIDSGYKGLSAKDVQAKTEYFGQNSYEIPIPSFLQLLKEHMLAPFFVFQVFSISCWMFDEYFTYPLFSLISLVIIEANTVRTRQSNLLELRGVESEPIHVHAYRDGQWTYLPSDRLLPGDIVFLNSEIMVPADLLLLSGRAIVNEAMLTGESTPQVKEPISALENDHRLDTTKDKRYILFGGTRIEQIIPGENPIYTPMNGCTAYVLSTGLGSNQGRLIRTILFASERVSAESQDAMKVLLFLTVFAICSAGYVVYYGLQSTSISTYKLLVEAIMIITSTIPPDLPMELTFSVNASLLALSKLYVYCTEPFRIPFAGTVSVCCFDKTGTLTAEEYKFIGIDEMSGAENSSTEISGNLVIDPKQLKQESMLVIGGCHSLVSGTDGKLVGDALEAASFAQLGFTISSSGKSKNKKEILLTNNKSFHFSAELRRMSTIVTTEQKKCYVLAKGAPEIISELLDEIPENFASTYRNYTRQGCRVLALAIKQIQESQISKMTREEAESHLVFVGFSVFAAPFKRGSEDSVVELLKSTHRVIVITGDDPLTACSVAQKLHIITKPPIIHDDGIVDSNGNPAQDGDEFSLCFTGRALEKISEEEFAKVVLKCNIFARMSPQNKEHVVIKLRDLGEKVLMCGDGTNDVGALKQAHVGVGLVEKSIVVEMNEDDYTPKLGAASIAAPFVSKRATITACIDLIRFGRATLSSTIDLFKQLSLNCLVNAYSMSVLYIENVKFGDQQMTLIAIALSIAFMSVSMAKPIRHLSAERPFESQFNMYLVFSVLIQSAVHLISFIFIRRAVFDTGYTNKPFDSKVVFEPGLMNTAMFILTSEMQVSTFISNYRGRPFTQSFFENKLLFISINVATFLIGALCISTNPTLLETFQLVQFPTEEFRFKICATCIFDVIMCFIGEKVCLFIFTMKNKMHDSSLVGKDVQKAIESYKKKNDDNLPESNHKFGIIDMFKTNFELQKKMVMSRNDFEKRKKLKELSSNKLAKKQFMKQIKRQEQLIKAKKNK